MIKFPKAVYCNDLLLGMPNIFAYPSIDTAYFTYYTPNYNTKSEREGL